MPSNSSTGSTWAGFKRGLVFDRLVAHIEPPAGVSRDGVLALDPAMLESWQPHLGLHVDEPKTKKSRLALTE